MGRLAINRRVIEVALLCSCLSLKAQIPYGQTSQSLEVFHKEIPKLVVNNDILICGERLHYKMYNLTESGETSALSKISYVSLRDGKDSVVFEHKIKFENGSAHGTFFVPTTLQTGIYMLLGHTNFSLNNRENGISSRKIYIVNPYIKPTTIVEKDSAKPKEVLSSRTISDVENRFSGNGISVISDKASYSRREKISVVIENPNGKFGFGNYVLSVRKVDLVGVRNSNPLENTIEIEEENVFYIPEFRGELLSGKVLTIDTNVAAVDKLVALSLPSKNYVFKQVKTDANGRFFISIDEPYETTRGIVQIVGPDREKYKVLLDKKEIHVKTDWFKTLKQDSGIKQWLQNRSIEVQIENAYFDENSLRISEDTENTPFYGNLGTEYVLDDYTRFPTLDETFVEVITLARVRKSTGKKVFEVFNPFNPIKSGPSGQLDPLLLLDGVLVQPEEVFAYDFKDIESIRVFPEPYRYGPKIFSGIIDFTTKRGGFEPRIEGSYIKEFELIRPLADKEYSALDHSTESYKRLPDYRTQLFWEPNINMSSERIIKEFYTSDVTGEFQIELKGYTNNGKFMLVRHYFEVK